MNCLEIMIKLLYSIIVCLLSIQWGYAQGTSIANYQYWIDQTGHERAITKAVNGTDVCFSVDTKNLQSGIHNLYFRFQDNNEMWSTLQSWLFFAPKLMKKEGIKILQCEYWIDSDEKQEFTIDGEQVSFVLDAIGVGEGLHTLNYRVKDDEGLYSPLQTWIFIKNAQRDTTILNKTTGVEYWFDEWSKVLKSYMSFNDTIIFSADASSLKPGLHTLNYRVKDILGNFSHTHTWAFYKTEYKTPTISWYKYWWNNHYDKAVEENVESNGNEFVFNEELIIPEYVMKDESSDNSTARFQIVFGDDLGNISNIEWMDVTYLDDPIAVNVVRNECSSIKVWSNNHLLHITGVYKNQNVCIYNSDGAMVYQDRAAKASMAIPLNKSGIYLIRIDDDCFKALVR